MSEVLWGLALLRFGSCGSFRFLRVSSYPPPFRGQSGASPGDITFTKDIAPILQRSCQPCHRPDGVAPMPLVTYEQVRPWAREMKMRTSLGPKAGVMPPWFVEKDIGIQISSHPKPAGCWPPIRRCL